MQMHGCVTYSLIHLATILKTLFSWWSKLSRDASPLWCYSGEFSIPMRLTWDALRERTADIQVRRARVYYESQHNDPTQLRRKCSQTRHWKRTVHRLESSFMRTSLHDGLNPRFTVLLHSWFCLHFASRFSSPLHQLLQRNWQVSYCESRRCPRIGASKPF